MREIRLYGSEGGGAGRSPYPYQPVNKPRAKNGIQTHPPYESTDAAATRRFGGIVTTFLRTSSALGASRSDVRHLEFLHFGTLIAKSASKG